MILPGWTCSTCHAFCGEAKERMSVCRACGAPRPAEIDALTEVLEREDLSDGEKVIFGDMRRVIEVYGVRLTPGQISWLSTVQRRPKRLKTVQEAAKELEIEIAEPPKAKNIGFASFPSIKQAIVIAILVSFAIITLALLHR